MHGVFQPPGCAAHDVEALYRRGAAVAIPCLFGKDFLSACVKPGSTVQKKSEINWACMRRLCAALDPLSDG
jgi:hypothetical protein